MTICRVCRPPGHSDVMCGSSRRKNDKGYTEWGETGGGGGVIDKKDEDDEE